MLSFCPRTLRRLALCATGAAILLSSNAAWCWETAHGKPDNTGFANVVTAPAKTPRMIGNIGTIARGAGPVVAPDGTVYLGNEQGKLMSFRADGTPGWSRELGSGQAILASPAVGSDGKIYVVSVRQYTDQRVDPPVRRADSTLHIFAPGGGWLSQTPFPEHNGGGGTTASPNFWRFNGVELVIVPAIYRRQVGGGIDVRLIAFTSSGGIVADQRATSIVPEITGGSGLPTWYLPVCMLPPLGPAICYGLAEQGGFEEPDFGPAPPPFPGIGIYTNPLGGTPWIILSDHYKDLVGFTFSLDNIFYEAFRLHDDNRYMRSAPAVLSSKHTLIGMEDAKRDDNGTQSGAETGGVLFSGPNPAKLAPVTGLKEVFATPTQLADGRVILIGGTGELSVLNGRQVTAKVKLPGYSIASAAASRTHLFVSTASAFQTFDPASLTELARVDWSRGGESPPVIGPQGHVYAIANDTLFAFGRPINAPAGSATGGTGGGPVVVGGGVFQDSGDPSPQQQSKAYDPPLTINGNRLFACEELDQDDCGKGDHTDISLAWCQKQGYPNVQDYDVDSKKVKAETLDGQFCSKNKCKVFDEIVCKK